jgi:hypothetical protein
LIYVTFRAINILMIFVALPAQHRTAIVGAFETKAGTPAPGLATFATNWDGQWYWEIAVNGYPNTLPVDQLGNVQQNPWAFFPGFPFAIRTITHISGLEFPTAALLSNMILGAVASILLYWIVRNRSTSLSPTISCALFNAFICAPVFLMAYSDPLAVVLTLGILAILERRIVWPIIPLLCALSLTRAALPAFAIFFFVNFVRAWHRQRWTRNARLQLTLSIISGFLSFAWPAAAALTTGDRFAYWRTQSAWARDVGTIPPLDALNTLTLAGFKLPVALLLVAALPIFIISSLIACAPSPALKSWSSSYAIFLLALLTWNGTLLRYFLLAIPAAWPLAQRRQMKWPQFAIGVLLMIMLLMLQWFWIRHSAIMSFGALFPP